MTADRDDAPRLPEGWRLCRVDAVGSTNDEARALARAGAPEGTLVWAKEQTAGRGRRGRAWSSPPGNLYLSLVVRPDGDAAGAAQLGFVAVLALTEAVDTLAGGAIKVQCKWPNDALVGGRKLSGILLESETTAGGRVAFVVIGVGVNIASSPRDSEYPATSLAAEGRADITPARLLAVFAGCFASWLARWRDEGFVPVRTAWLARAAGLGAPIRVRLDRDNLTGRFLDLDAGGALVLEAPDGRRLIAAGDVFPVSPMVG